MLICPQCHSNSIQKLNLISKTISSIGAIAGAINGGIKAYCELNKNTTYPVLNKTTAIIFGIFTGGIAGISSGLALGQTIEVSAQTSYRCNDCGYRFYNHSKQHQL